MPPPRTPRTNDGDELEGFEREINLTEFAAALGYQIDRGQSSRGSVVMRHPGTLDKIVVRREEDQHWTYFSVRDSADNGSVIDFVQRRWKVRLGEVRRELRQWLGVDHPIVSPQAYAASLASSTRDRAKLQGQFAAAGIVANVPYLNGRGIRPETLADGRFREAFRQDARGNVLFPHRDDQGLSGFEVKNHRWTAFTTGGTKSLWYSQVAADDRRLVIAESAIDALSYHQLHPDAATRYASTAGTLSQRQLDLVAQAIAALPPGGMVIAAFDADDAGAKLAAVVQTVAGNVHYRRHAPAPPHKDWNDVLQAKERNFIRSVRVRRDLDLG